MLKHHQIRPKTVRMSSQEITGQWVVCPRFPPYLYASQVVPGLNRRKSFGFKWIMYIIVRYCTSTYIYQLEWMSNVFQWKGTWTPHNKSIDMMWDMWVKRVEMLKAFASYHDIFGCCLDTGGTTCFSIRKPVAGASILLATRLRAAWFMFFRHYAADLAPIEKRGFGSRGIYTLFWIHGRMMDPTCLKNTINSELVKSIKSYWHYFMLKINGCYWFEYLYFTVKKHCRLARISKKTYDYDCTLALSPKVLGPCFFIGLHDNSTCHLLHSFTWCFD